MRKKVKFDKGIQEIQINQDAGFKHLNLISAIIHEVDDLKVKPSVELIFINDTLKFRLYSNLVPGTGKTSQIDPLIPE